MKKQYCYYCASCLYIEGKLSCDKLEKDLTPNQAQRENHCPDFYLSPMGHVITGKKYRPQQWRYMRVYEKGL